MPTYRVKMLVKNREDWAENLGKTREVVSRFFGCKDENDAKAKAQKVFDVVKFKTVELVKDKNDE
jgi:hypothetical protein